ncbi:YidC/Oxa1 family membrane protein insertase [Herbaspirillum sp. Sphag1AN]|uniref:membrane protein insertase YidC n=1 Tax=unclassified Herbaspirillum TaxID=2624150 RepID=UPI001617950A|nr:MULTISPECIES: membrane protein insertase YidC [unclassified Herbaspirillum]MBB3213991.1 YidC/Oxa1 family membrane protein insertase [Herbaspirillum sp. Sphag1AN]MBB3247188.1 YidC/Oxa1 family membrane protein insertase [Herbaspirillum sp. Sphag64]
MDIKRTVLWVVFSFSLLLLWDSWMRHNGKPSMFFPSATQQVESAAAGTDPSKLPAPQLPQSSQSTPSAGANDVAGVPATKGETITITTDLVKAEIDTVGGELKRLELLKHADTVDPSKNLVLFDSTAGHTYLAESGLIGGAFPNHKTIFTAQPGPRTLENGNEVQLVLVAEENGVKLTKTYTFKRGDYLIDLKHTVTNNSTAAISPSLYLQLLRDGNKPGGESHFYSTFTGPAVYTDAEKFQKLTFDKIEAGKEQHASKSDNGWIALVQHYFVSAIIPPENAQRDIFTKKVADNLYAVGNILPMGSIAPGASVTMDARLYSGPQVASVLEKTAPGLELVKDYGWLTIIAKPIFWLMIHIHAVVGNWGWTIILLTMLIKAIFFPLSAASYRSMAKMKAVTPKMTAIRERHKGDPQAMNREMMALYKTEKINPLGGCLPIVIQIPVFISLYWVLLASVEMRGAPWLGWIHDLTAPDPFYILPVLMAVSMFIQTKLNPTPPDPVQAKVMMFMPIVFSFMFFFFPSGLVLYWVVNNVLSITQQWVITRKLQTGKAK